MQTSLILITKSLHCPTVSVILQVPTYSSRYLPSLLDFSKVDFYGYCLVVTPKPDFNPNSNEHLLSTLTVVAVMKMYPFVDGLYLHIIPHSM